MAINFRHKVGISGLPMGTRPLACAWCNETIGERSITWSTLQTRPWIFTFRFKKDAVWFKLKWL